MKTHGQALSRFVVIDLTRVRSGPAAVRQLADWGADVIKVEEPSDVPDDKPGGSAQFGDYQNTHRSKRSVTLNLRHAEGVALFKRLVETADVIVENYRPDVKFRLGIDYESMRKINPRIVYASVSGFGQDGPYAKRPGLDQIAQGLGGIMSVTGEAGRGPMRAGIAVADIASGLFAAIGILTALLEREQSGQGQWVQTSLLQAQISLMDFQAMRWLINKEVPAQSGNDHPTTTPVGVFESSDGYLNIAAMGNDLYARLCKVLGLESLIDDARFASNPLRTRNRAVLHVLLGEQLRKRSTAELLSALNEAGVPCGPILSLDETFADPQVEHLRMAVSMEHPVEGTISVLGQPVVMSRTAFAPPTHAPARGEHNAEVYGVLGIADEELGNLRARGVI